MRQPNVLVQEQKNMGNPSQTVVDASSRQRDGDAEKQWPEVPMTPGRRLIPFRKLSETWIRSEFRKIQGIWIVLLTLCAALLCGAEVNAQVTYAGTQFNVAGSALASPGAVAVDSHGTVYIADSGHNRVVSILPSVNGDAVPTTLISGLSAPGGVAVDASGNLYVSDTGNNRVLMLTSTQTGFGNPVTIATGLSDPAGLVVDSHGNLYIADTGNNRAVEMPRAGGGFGAFVILGTGLSGPAGIAVDPGGSVYIADTGNNRVVKEPITASGYAAQQPVSGVFVSPTSVTVDKGYDLYITETGTVLEYLWAAGANRYNGQLVVGSGFSLPTGVATDLNGNAYVVDATSNQLIEVLPGGVNFGAWNPHSTAGTLAYNFDIAAGTTVGAVSIFTQGLAGGDFVDATGSTCRPQTYAVATACSVSVAFTPLASGLRMGAAVLYDNLSKPLATAYFSGTGMQPKVAFMPGAEALLNTQLSSPSGITVDAQGNVYIADTGNNRVVELARTGNGYAGQVTVPLTALNSPMGLAVDGAGNLYVVSNGNDKVVKLPWTGTGYGLQVKVGVSFYGPSAVTVDGNGNVYVADTLDNRVYKLQWTGTTYAQALALGNYTKNPTGVAVNPGGNVYFTLPYLNDLSEVPESPSGYLAQVNLQLKGISFPSALAIDGNSNLFILDTNNNRVLMLPWTGSSFGSQITVASGFNAPQGMALDGDGNLYVADTGNNQVMKIDLYTPGTMAFADTYIGSTSADSARMLLVNNLGNQPLLISDVNYPPDFPENGGASNACAAGATVDPGAACELAVDFTPATIGSPLREVVSITDNTLSLDGSLQPLTVTGRSLAQLSQAINFATIATATYGAGPISLAATASSGLPVTYQVVSGPATLVSGGRSLSLTGAGTVVVMASQIGSSAYTAAEGIQSFVVAPATLIVTPQNVTAVYGALPASFAYAFSGFVLNQNAAQVTGKPAISVDSSSNVVPGTYNLTASLGTLSAANYIFVYHTGKLTVNKASLTVIAVNQFITYGGTLPAITYEAQGFVNGDTQSNSVKGMPQLGTAATSRSAAGKYSISVSLGTLSSANYNFIFSAGILTINKAVLMVTAINQSMVYGGLIPSLTCTISGFLNGDAQSSSVSGEPQFTTTATGNPSAGKFGITVGLGTLSSSNYGFVFSPGVLTVNKVPLTLTASSGSMVYGAALPLLSYAVAGFVNGDTQNSSVIGAPQLTTTATKTSSVGNYTVAIGAGTLSAANYSFQYVPGSLTVSKAVLTVAAANASMTYGGAIHAIAASITGFVNGDTAQSAVTGGAKVTSPATSASPVGAYAITTDVGTLAAKNYSFVFKSATMTVNPAPLTVTANNLSMIAGQPLPALTYSVTGWVSKESLVSAAEGAPSLSTSATASSPAGSYAISVKQGTMQAANYALTFVNGVLTVTSQSGGAIIPIPISSPFPWLPVIPRRVLAGPLAR